VIGGGEQGRRSVARISDITVALILAAVGSTLVGASALSAALGARQVLRDVPVPPLGVLAAAVALPLGLLCWRSARLRLDAIGARDYDNWRLRES
jgi:hypothetical protein